jgi:hypothetical protein
LVAVLTPAATVAAVTVPSDPIDPPSNAVFATGGVNLGAYGFNDLVRAAAVDPATGITYVGGDFTQVGVRTGAVAPVDAPDSGSDDLSGPSLDVLGTDIAVFENDDSSFLVTGNVTSVKGDGVRRGSGTIRLMADGTVDTQWSLVGPCANDTSYPIWDIGDQLVQRAPLSNGSAGLSTVGVAFISKANSLQTVAGGGTGDCAQSIRIWPSIDPFPPFAACRGWTICTGYVGDVTADPSNHTLVTQTIITSQSASVARSTRAWLVGYDMQAGTRSWWTELETPLGSPADLYQGEVTRMVALGDAVLAVGYFPLDLDRATASTMLLLDEHTGEILQRWNAAGEQDLDDPAAIISVADGCTPADNGRGNYINWTFARLAESSAIGWGSWTDITGGRRVSVCQYGLSGSGGDARLMAQQRGTFDAQLDPHQIYSLPSTIYAGRYLVGGFGAFDLETNAKVSGWNPGPSTSPESVIAVGHAIVLAGSRGGGEMEFIHTTPAMHVAALDSNLAPVVAFSAQLPDTERSVAGIQDVRDLKVAGDQLLVAGDVKGPFGRGPVLALDLATGALEWGDGEAWVAVGLSLAVEESTGAFYVGLSSADHSSNLRRYVPTATGFDLDPSFAHPVGPFGAETGAAVTGVDWIAGRLYVGGYFGSIDGQPRQGLARLAADGSLDSWAPALLDELAADPGAGIELQPRSFIETNGKVAVSGLFWWYPKVGGTSGGKMMSNIIVYDAESARRLRPVDSDEAWFPTYGAYGGHDMALANGLVYVAMAYSGVQAFDPDTFDYLPDRSSETAFDGVNFAYALVVAPGSPQSLASADPTSATTSALVVGGRMPRWGNQIAGNVVALSLAAADTVPPDTSVPSVAIKEGQVVGSTITVNVSWPAATDSSGVGLYELQVKKGTGAWGAATLTSATALSADLPLRPGKYYAFRLRATDNADNRSGWKQTTTAKLIVNQENASVLKYTGRWRRVALSGASAGYVKRSSVASAIMAYTFTGSSVGLVTVTGPSRGRFEVWLDGAKVATIDLYTAAISKRRVVWSTSGIATGIHTLQLRVLGTKNGASSGVRVDVDAVLRWS